MRTGASVVWLLGTLAIGCGSRGHTDVDAAPPDPGRLAGLELSAGDLVPAFDPAVLGYSVACPLDTGFTSVTATAAVPGAATLTVAGATIPSTPLTSGVASDPLTLAIDGLVLAVTVTPTTGTPVTYQVTVNRGAGMAQRAYLKSTPPVADGGFGTSVALLGDRIAVGEPRAGGGRVHVFVRSGATWTEEDVVTPANPDANDLFGWSVAFGADDVLVVGAPGEASASAATPDDDSLPGAGAAYLFVRAGSTWSQQGYLKAANPRAGVRFGHRVGMSSPNLLVVSAPDEASAATGIDGDQNDTSAPGAGAVYAFSYSSGWVQEAYLKASDSGAGDHFGDGLSLRGSLLAVGAPGWDPISQTVIDQGMVYVFRRPSTTWTEEDKLGVASGVGLGGAVSAGEQISFGAAADSGGGGLHVFAAPSAGTDWPEETHLIGGAIPGVAWMGDCVADASFVPTLLAASAQMSSGRAALVFGRVAADTWPLLATLASDNQDPEDGFGASLAFSYPTVVVGAPGEASDGNPSDNSVAGSGAVYVFE